MSLSPEEKADKRREKRAAMLRDTFEPVYEDLNTEQLKNEILRLLTQQKDLEEDKKAHNESFNALITEKKDAIEFCRERIDYIQHEEGVAAHLENQG